MEPILRSVQVLKQEAEEIGYEGKEVAEYVKQNQALDGEGRAAWRDAQKLYAEEKKRDEIWMAEVQAEAEEKNRTDEIQAEEKRCADEIRIQMAKIEADKELTLRDGTEGPSSNQKQCCS